MATTAPTPKSILDVRTPIFFASVDDASAFLNKIADPESPDFCPDFADGPLVLNGLDDEGNFDSALYTPETQVMFHTLTNRGKKAVDAAGKEITSPATLRAIIVTPVPTQEAVEADKTGAEWLARIFRTQITKAACDPIRTAADVKLASKDMPLTLADFVTTSRESSSVMEAFDSLYRGILDLFKDKSPAFARARLNKAEFKKALESRAYALDVYSNLEDRGDKPSMFVMALHFGIKEAKTQGMDPTVFETWLTTRDEAELPSVDADEADELDDLDSLEGLTLAAPAPVEAAPAEAPAA